VADSRSRVLSLVASAAAREGELPAEPVLEPGLADVITLQRRKAAALSRGDEQSLFLDTVAEYQWARDTAGLAPTTLDGLTKPIIETCRHYGVVPWRLTPRQVDSYFAGVGKRARSTVRRKLTLIDHYFAFLEQRYAGEIARRYGAAVESPIDAFNRPKHRGGYGLRIPRRSGSMREFFGRWRESLPEARKPVIARRDYVMGKLTYISGGSCRRAVRGADRRRPLGSGQWGRFLVHGKGARGSGPRQREAYLFEEGRALLW
jgi:integrase/recombinase XerC